MKDFLRKNPSRSKGQSTLEFVMVLPFVFLVILAVSQFAVITHLQNKVTHAAREGARVLSLTNSEEMMQTQVSQILDGLQQDRIAVRVEPPDPAKRTVGRTAQVHISYGYTGFLGLLEILSWEGIEIKAHALMLMECSYEKEQT